MHVCAYALARRDMRWRLCTTGIVDVMNPLCLP